jgi:hypothetical protein
VKTKHAWLGIVGVCLLATVRPVQSGMVNFTLDPNNSFLTLSGTVSAVDGTISVGPSAVTAQDPPKTGDPGSLKAFYTGNLLIDQGPSSVSFPGGSSIDAINYAGANGVGGTPVSLTPSVGGTAASPGAAADYGMNFKLTEFVIITVASGPMAIRNLVADITSGGISTSTVGNTTSWASNLAGASAENLLVTAGNLDYYATLGSVVGGGVQNGTAGLAGLPTTSNSNATHSTIVVTNPGVSERITMPFTVIINYTDVISPTTPESITVNLTLSGQIVGVGVPEPSTLTLFGFGVVGLLSYAWRSRRRKL